MNRAAWLSLLIVSVAMAAPATRLDLLRGDTASQAFERALEPKAFEFPRDHGPHPRFRHEWWYVTGHLDGASGERFGFELTFFRYALSPRGTAPIPGEASAWRTTQLYAAHFAITDLERRGFHFTERYSREALGLAGAQAAPFRVWLEDWALTSADSTWKLHAASDDYVLELDLQPLSRPVANGEAGLSRKSGEPGSASYYYSIPRLSAHGRLLRDGRPIAVQGLAWLDREWGSGALAANQLGWDWFALQLDDGSTLMFYALRRSDGRRDLHSAGTWVDPDGRVRRLNNEDVRIDVLDHWESPHGGRYPSRWRLRVANLALDVMIRPKLAAQELGTRPRYWEGAVAVAGRRGDAGIGGRGYVELVGYAVPE